MEDLEQNFDDLCTLALTDKKKLEGVAAPGGVVADRRRARRLSRSHKSFSGTNLAAAGAAPPEVGSVCMHVIVLSEDKQPAIKSPSMSRVIRQSFADNRADEAQTVKSYGRVLAAKAATLRSNGVRRVSVLLPKSSATEATGADNIPPLQLQRRALLVPRRPLTHVYHAKAPSTSRSTSASSCARSCSASRR